MPSLFSLGSITDKLDRLLSGVFDGGPGGRDLSLDFGAASSPVVAPVATPGAHIGLQI